MRTLSQKLGVKAGMRSVLIDAPDGYPERLADIDLKWAIPAAEDLDYIHAFVTRAEALDSVFSSFARRLSTDGLMFISWPKSGQLGTDLNIKSVIEIGYNHGLVESTALSVDTVWSALKFTHPKRGKVYQNSYGTLSPDHRRR